MHIEPFGVEIWMNAWETRCDWNLAETCVDSLTIAELLDITGHNDTDLQALLPMRMSYGEIEGSERLRSAIAQLYGSQSPENVVVTHGTIGANMLVHKTLLSAGDHVISIVPTYQQHYSIPASLGANVECVTLREENGWLPDLDTLKSVLRADTRLIALTNPNNPTGALIPRAMLEEIAEMARAVGAWILCDEVYRGTHQSGVQASPSIVDLYERGISTASVSKAFSLAGLRLGWIAAPPAFLSDVSVHRDYDTISVGMLDDHFATLALEHSDTVLGRSQRIVRENCAALSSWVNSHECLSWVAPQAGTTAWIKTELARDSEAFCVDLLKHTGVMFTPGKALNMEGYVRVGFANHNSILLEGLARATDYLAEKGC